MRAVFKVFDALAAGPSPLTRAEIEAATDLVRDEVIEGLRSLRRRNLLVMHGQPRERVRYSLVSGAIRPTEGRGRYSRTLQHRQLKSMLRFAQLGRVCLIATQYSPARPQGTHCAAGRMTSARAATRCLLAEALGYRSRRHR